jgi:hypothetical protein
MCGRSCIVPNAVTVCLIGTCRISSCDPGFADCDRNVENGCETATAADGGARYVEMGIMRPMVDACSLPGAKTLIMGPVDDATGTATMPFPFTFYGISSSTVWASSNGLMGVGSAPVTAAMNSCLPTGAFATAMAPFWDDLVLQSFGRVCGGVTGT